jgi:hypothetical protein
MSATTKPGTIRFDVDPAGTLDTGAGLTDWAYLPAIFTLANTRTAYDKAIGGCRFQTDAAGLELLADISERAEDGIADAVEVIGILLANVKADEVSPSVINRAGWLLAGLTGLRGIISGTRSDAAYHLGTGAYAVTGEGSN